MSADRVVVIELARVEATHLAGLVGQFADLIEETDDTSPDDPAVARLVPDGYTDDSEASAEFRELTQRELLDRRASDAARVLATLHETGELPEDAGDSDAALRETVSIPLDREDLQAWLRTLAAVRLVLASRLGIRSEEDHDEEDPRFGIYDWLGFRLDGLVRAADETY